MLQANWNPKEKSWFDIQMLIDKIILLHWKWFYLYLIVCSWSTQIPFIKKGVLSTHFIKKGNYDNHIPDVPSIFFKVYPTMQNNKTNAKKWTCICPASDCICMPIMLTCYVTNTTQQLN